jgi:SAM-dependent methyltransferase
MPNESHNRNAWNKLSGPNCPWSVPVQADELEAAARDDFDITVAGPRPIPKDWLGACRGRSILCLGSGGGQQAPILAAAGCIVTLLDISDEQLSIDREVCSIHGLDLSIEQGSMTDLSRFERESFDLIVNPVSNPYVPDLPPVWKECARVLVGGGRLISGSINPLNYLFSENEGHEGEGLEVVYPLPFVESETLSSEELQAAISRDMVFTWSHSLEDIIQGQIEAGFLIAGLQESRRTDPRAPSINRYSPTYIATLAIRSAV